VLAPPTADVDIKLLGTDGPLDAGIESIALLGSQEQIRWQRSPNGLTIRLLEKLPDLPVVGFRISCK